MTAFTYTLNQSIFGRRVSLQGGTVNFEIFFGTKTSERAHFSLEIKPNTPIVALWQDLCAWAKQSVYDGSLPDSACVQVKEMKFLGKVIEDKMPAGRENTCNMFLEFRNNHSSDTLCPISVSFVTEQHVDVKDAASS